MMFLLAFWAFFQICIIPGSLFLTVFRIDMRGLVKLPFIFALSLLVNYVTVILLVLLGLYVRGTVLGVAALELVSLLILQRANLRIFLRKTIDSGLVDPIHKASAVITDSEESNSSTLLRPISVSIALLALLAALVLFFENLGNIFRVSDAVVSWNRWALEWYAGNWPRQTWHYPQLLPANWSMSYHILGAPLQYVARAVMGLFPIATVVVILAVAQRLRSVGLFIATALCLVLEYLVLLDTMTDGIADMASPFFSVLALSFFISNKPFRTEDIDAISLGGLIAGAAPVVKQSGLWVMLLFPVLLGLHWFHYRQAGSAVYKRAMMVWFASTLLIAASAYGAVEFMIAKGIDSSEIPYVTHGIFRGKPIPERIFDAWRLAVNTFSVLGLLLYVLVTSPFSLIDRQVRLLFILITLPMTLFWAAYFSYDMRNLSPTLPFWAISAGMGLEKISVSRILSKFRDTSLWLASLAALLLLVLYGTRYSKSTLQKRHISQEKLIGDAKLNFQLYVAAQEHGSGGMILTNYQLLDYLPGFKGRTRLLHFEIMDQSIIENYFQEMKSENVLYLLIPENANPDILSDVENRVRRGELALIFFHGSYRFYKKR